MADHLPLLVFPQAKTISPPKGRGFPSTQPHLPGHGKQVARLTNQLANLQQDFAQYKASISGALAGLEPETVLVIEIAGSVDDFKQAVEAAGLEWIGEWDIEDIEPNDDFNHTPKIGVDFFRKNIESITTRAESKIIRGLFQEQHLIDSEGKLLVEDLSDLRLPDKLVHLKQDILYAVNNAKMRQLDGRLFLSLGNEAGLRELLALWEHWKKNEKLPNGKTKWRDVFNQTVTIRRWGINETLRETGMIDRWRDLLDPIHPKQEIHCQIELFYRRDSERRKLNEHSITALLAEIGGRTLGAFIDMQDIAFHAVKAELPANGVRRLLEELNSPDNEIDIQLFKFPGVMYFRPTGQSLAVSMEGAGEAVQFPEGVPEQPPVAAILDGVPNLQHAALKDRLLFDDPDNLADEYQAGERKHGTSMASLVVHGELIEGQFSPLQRKVYHLPIMQPDPKTKNRDEHVPDDIFFEDRIERAVRRMLEGDGNTPAQAPGVKIINLSIGDPERPFIHTPSPWARLLDWLSWKYRVLFCVSAGNCSDSIDINMSNGDFLTLSDEEKVAHVLKCVEKQLSARRLLSPAESLNALTIGALHTDESGSYPPGHRTDLLPNSALPSLASRVGHGFRRSVKPEIFFPGGRQLYQTPHQNSGSLYKIDESKILPGQKVAWDSKQQGELSLTVYTRGTSNATALATRSGVRIYEVLQTLQTEHGEQIRNELMAVLVKTLLVHGAQHDEEARVALTGSLKTQSNSRRFKEVMARYVGYGAVDIERVLACTAQRGTVLGSGEIRENEVHEYRFPLPPGLSGTNAWRRMVVTLAWISPINPDHRNLREAKLELSPHGKWDELSLRLARQDTDHNQVMRGTVQHEILEGSSQIAAYQDGQNIHLHVTCKADATEKLDQAIPYGLAVTLEVAEGIEIPIYEQLRARLKTRVAVGMATGNS